MTIVATYYTGDQALFITDFRVSLTDDQMDILIKFKGLDNRFGIFVAGDVSFWRQAIPKIKEILPDVTKENILNFDGPLREVLNDEAMGYIGDDSGALAFLLDEKSNTNKVLKIKIDAGCGAIISEIPRGKAVVIGSGNAIPNIQQRLSDTLSGALEFYQDKELRDFGHLMRTEILTALDECGSMSFQKLGISPCMSISILDGSHFHMVGEIIEGGHLSDKGRYFYKYSFEGDKQGKIILRNLQNNKVQTMKSFMDADFSGEIFDPELHTSKID